MKKVTVIQHLLFEDLGSFAAILEKQGYVIEYLQAGYDDLSQLDPLSDAIWVVLGGPIGVNDIADYPFLQQEIALLQQRLEADKVTLGICLGAQLMASALGAKIYAGRKKEIGWGKLFDIKKHSVLQYLTDIPVLHWHGDTFDIPDGAVCLASSKITPHQAFSWQKNSLALQFHPEVTAQGMERWFIGHTAEIHAEKLSVQQLRADTLHYATALEMAGAKMLDTWLKNQIR